MDRIYLATAIALAVTLLLAFGLLLVATIGAPVPRHGQENGQVKRRTGAWARRVTAAWQQAADRAGARGRR